jgi:hypothetical protein
MMGPIIYGNKIRRATGSGSTINLKPRSTEDLIVFTDDEPVSRIARALAQESMDKQREKLKEMSCKRS